MLWLISLPFGKFFHIIERPATVGVELYWRTGEGTSISPCARCGEEFGQRASWTISRTLTDLGQDYAWAIRASKLSDHGARQRHQQRLVAGFLPRPASACIAARPTGRVDEANVSCRQERTASHDVSINTFSPVGSSIPTTSIHRRAASRRAGPPTDQVDRYVPTHCCYCGVQCGMYLKVAAARSSASSRATTSRSIAACSAPKASTPTKRPTTPTGCATR